MSRLAFDLESNGLLDKLDTIHCIWTEDLDSGERRGYRPDEIASAIHELENADEIVGHNIIRFDIPAIRIVAPEFNPKGKATDTLLMSQAVYPMVLRERDAIKAAVAKRRKKPWTLPRHLMGRHSLEAWGHRLGMHKGDYAKEMKAKGLDPWSEFNESMFEYCEQDVALTVKLYRMLLKSKWSQKAFDLEHEVLPICNAMEEHGCSFDEEKAQELYLRINKEKWECEEELKKVFGSWWEGERFTPKRDHSGHGYVKGAPLTKIKRVEFNPASRAHIAKRLKELRGWKPKQFTNSGQPKVDEAVLNSLKYPEAKKLARYFLLNKRVGQIAEGNNGWLKLVKPDGRIYGRINQNGTITCRASHSKPNLGQVPATRSEFGADCRSLFRATPGLVMVGADASGLELRCLAHYLSRYDGGKYAKIVVEGNKEDGTDAHTVNQKAAGLESRDGKDPSKAAKPFIYALLYGGGDALLGGGNAKKGAALRAKFMRGIPGFNQLVSGVKKAARKRGKVKSLDGRYLWVRHQHAALNTLLQGAGAVIMKQAMVNYHRILEDEGIPFHQVFWVHDEFQVECEEEHAHAVGQAMVEGIRQTTQSLDLGCPMDGEYIVGKTWADTH